MKKLFAVALFSLLFSTAAFSQSKMGGMSMKDKPQPTEKDKTEAIPSKGVLKRGAPIGNSKKVSLAKLLNNPQKFADRSVKTSGVIVRSCKAMGCWLEITPKGGSGSVRVATKDHAFFIPLNSAGANATVEGMLKVKNLSAAEVKHMMEDDGAKFDKVNADGSVTEISFEATGVELKRKN